MAPTNTYFFDDSSVQIEGVKTVLPHENAFRITSPENLIGKLKSLDQMPISTPIFLFFDWGQTLGDIGLVDEKGNLMAATDEISDSDLERYNKPYIVGRKETLVLLRSLVRKEATLLWGTNDMETEKYNETLRKDLEIFDMDPNSVRFTYDCNSGNVILGMWTIMMFAMLKIRDISLSSVNKDAKITTLPFADALFDLSRQILKIFKEHPEKKRTEADIIDVITPFTTRNFDIPTKAWKLFLMLTAFAAVKIENAFETLLKSGKLFNEPLLYQPIVKDQIVNYIIEISAYLV